MDVPVEGNISAASGKQDKRAVPHSELNELNGIKLNQISFSSTQISSTESSFGSPLKNIHL